MLKTPSYKSKSTLEMIYKMNITLNHYIVSVTYSLSITKVILRWWIDYQTHVFSGFQRVDKV